ncbi:DUF4013 domain-containing protein [Methanogenium marinum]|uniref:DUF4013 domain-containing protein n=1 Tax=Methanogenium marinum TaxID=348610 RepID=A0A9Q4KPW7_9EURY|nr:DUF4013 domain-containing protein [Methanogenium marinum]MDE4908120.1 DUF4013 domain-containing protein [Methanogenium marinum]
MEIGKNIGESFGYTKEALIGKWVRWILLVIISIIPIVNFISNGYIIRVMRGTKPAPELEDYVQLFIDGLLYSIIMFIWMIPVLIVAVVFFGGAFLALMSGSDALGIAGAGSIFIGIPITFIVAILCGLFAYIGVVRFARMGKFGEAFAFGAIKDKIGAIGWANYIIALIVMFIVIFIIAIILGIIALIPFLGWIILFAAVPFLNIFYARFISNLYDSA